VQKPYDPLFELGVARMGPILQNGEGNNSMSIDYMQIRIVII